MLPPNSKDHLRKDAMQCRAKNVMMVGDAIKSVTNGSLHNKNAQVFLRSAQILCQNLCGIVLVMIIRIRMKVVVLCMVKLGVARILVIIRDFVINSSHMLFKKILKSISFCR